MASEKDTYKTIATAGEETMFKEKGSKFFGYAFPVTSEEEIRGQLDTLKKEHYSARHWCYAWQLGKGYERYRVNDDGEPSNSAGAPIYGQIQAFGLTNVLVVVVRYFGGTKLGVGGLIQAYKTSAKMALEASRLITRTIDENFIVQCAYADLNSVMRVVKNEQLKIVGQKMEMDCKIEISVRKKDSDRIFDTFRNLQNIQIRRR
ncbi:MAG: YigZ family protein [Bacteroidia bacterium]|nr:YigZ family protein [Bacteroidia bacterium]NNF30263.1 YigZ family protein [Flavobacteriaceae bacterium]MBT8277334.1 YigZ family protein [Bacteroidia bacterium]NNJ82807.1 YigZ family protein [Flavobacteriaceae bacterium]NNK54270.1 YigZ family protein [Flavobacteriaceae bacterium]